MLCVCLCVSLGTLRHGWGASKRTQVRGVHFGCVLQVCRQGSRGGGQASGVLTELPTPVGTCSDLLALSESLRHKPRKPSVQMGGNQVLPARVRCSWRVRTPSEALAHGVLACSLFS